MPQLSGEQKKSSSSVVNIFPKATNSKYIPSTEAIPKKQFQESKWQLQGNARCFHPPSFKWWMKADTRKFICGLHLSYL